MLALEFNVYPNPTSGEINVYVGNTIDGTVEVRMGNSVLLATVVSNKEARDDVDFLPLTVDYREKFAADGRFPGGFLKREARPTDHQYSLNLNLC